MATMANGMNTKMQLIKTMRLFVSYGNIAKTMSSIRAKPPLLLLATMAEARALAYISIVEK